MYPPRRTRNSRHEGYRVRRIVIIVSVIFSKFDNSSLNKYVYYESRKRELKTKPTYEYRCDERLKTKTEKSTHLGYTGLHGELEHLKMDN